MADKKADVKKATHKEFAEYLDANKPPEDIVVEINYGSGDEKRVVEFKFKRSTLIFGRYVKDAYGPDGNPPQAAAQFLIDSADKAERALVAAFVEAYPAEAISVAGALVDTYASGDVEAAIKNVSKPAES
jgi:hypothetical protein